MFISAVKAGHKMLANLFSIIIWGCGATCVMDLIIGPGMYAVTDIEKCPDSEAHIFELDIHRRKVNRTHDGFNCYMKFKQPLDDSYAVRIEICKYVDGGCKYFTVINDDCFTKFLNRYAGQGVQNFFSTAGLDLPGFPIPPCELQVTNYIFDYEQLPETGLYGRFGTHTTVLKRDGDTEEVVGCFYLTYEFRSDKEMPFF